MASVLVLLLVLVLPFAAADAVDGGGDDDGRVLHFAVRPQDGDVDGALAALRATCADAYRSSDVDGEIDVRGTTRNEGGRKGGNGRERARAEGGKGRGRERAEKARARARREGERENASAERAGA